MKPGNTQLPVASASASVAYTTLVSQQYRGNSSAILSSIHRGGFAAQTRGNRQIFVIALHYTLMLISQ